MKKVKGLDDNGWDFEELFSKNVVLKEEEFVNKDIVGDAIMARIQSSKQRSLRYVWAAASVVVVMLGTSTYLLSNEEFASKMNPKMVNLSDGSQVYMQKNSYLKYNRITWLWNRSIDFEGTAHFIVAKGKKFSVKTNFGNVEVLGTEFQVETGIKSLAVECFSGSVGVNTNVGNIVLHPNEKVKFSPQGMNFSPIKESLPPFLEFNGVPLVRVVDKMEELYSVTIQPKDICKDIIYDGLLPTDNLIEALEIVMSSCGLTYSINGNLITISQHVK